MSAYTHYVKELQEKAKGLRECAKQAEEETDPEDGIADMLRGDAESLDTLATALIADDLATAKKTFAEMDTDVAEWVIDISEDLYKVLR